MKATGSVNVYLVNVEGRVVDGERAYKRGGAAVAARRDVVSRAGISMSRSYTHNQLA